MFPARQCPRGCPVQEEFSALSYDARSITVLEGLEAVRKRPGMYIGSTGERGLHHLVQEVVDNAVDEALAGYADRIEVTLLADGGVRVFDNGRGIPVDNHPVENRPAVEVVLTTLHAGGKFDGKSYAVSGGLHGVGVSVVNALSSRLEVEIYKDGYVWRQSYAVSEPTGPVQKGEPTDETGTVITFWPDEDIFESTVWSFETLSRRLQEMAFLNRGLSITLTDERPDHINGEPHVVTYRYEGGIADFVRYLNASKEPVHELDHRVRRRGGGDLGRGRHAVDRLVLRVGAHLRQHDQHRRGRHPRGGLPRGADLDREPLRPGAEAAAGEGREPHRRRRRARASPRSSTSSWPSRSSRARPRPSSATPRPSRSCRRSATTTCGTGSSATRARPRRS